MAVISFQASYRDTKAALDAALKVVLDAVFPEFCVVCEREGQLICEGCLHRARVDVLHERCPFCERVTGSGSVCRKCAGLESLDGAVAMSQYAEPAVRGLIKNWKYASDTRAQKELAKLVRRVHLDNFLPDLPWTIVPANLHRAKANARGFDQAQRLAQIFAAQTEWPVADCLERVKNSPPQARAGQARKTPGELRRLYRTRGTVPECVLLVDDVLTTGATLDAAAHTLKMAGATNVWALTMARGA